MFKIFRRKRADRTWDFEGRCAECHKPLKLFLQRVTKQQVTLTVQSCEDHPNDSFILWPQRDDIEIIV